MKKFFKVPDAKFLMISQAFKTISRFKTEEQKVFGLTEIMKKTNILLKIAIARVQGCELTDKKVKIETDTIKLVNKIENEILKNKDILTKTIENKDLTEEFLMLNLKYNKIIERV